MILPNKHLPHSRSLIGVGGDILAELGEPRAVTELCERVKLTRSVRRNLSPLSYDWFVLALTFLYSIQAVDMENGVITPLRHGR